ncbi:hypothetical protein N0V85_007422 [Neurospora sp. IMI 360204]|nr:hypothetical protein N0V85_007422 [Neurospora sp. IMI 360204]
MASERALHIEDYESGIRSGRITRPPPDLRKYVGKIYEIEDRGRTLSRTVNHIIATTPKEASREDAERLLDQYIEPILENVEFLREIKKTRESHGFLDALHSVRSGPAVEVKMLRSLEDLEAIWKRAVDDAERALDKSLDELMSHLVHYQVLEALLVEQEGND